MTDQKIHDGGPAFPVWELNGNGQPEMTSFGMSLRDYFAAMFAAAMMTAKSADVGFPRPELKVKTGGPILAEHVAAIAYQLADAMLQAREDRADIASTKREQGSAA